MEAMMHLNTLVSNMFAAGLLDDQFRQLQMLKASNAPDFIAKVITLFCEDGVQIIGELAKLLNKPCVDFEKVDGFVHRLKGSSSSIGAQRVKNICILFHVFCQEKSKDGPKDLADSTELVGLGMCMKTLEAVRNDFYDLHSKFQTMLQLEQQVQAFHSKQ